MTRQRNRVQVTVSYPMRVALEVLAERSNLPLAAQAMVLLRQALDRTMQTDEVRQRVSRHVAQRNHSMWLEDTTTERAVELAYEATIQGEANTTETDTRQPARGS